MPHTTTTSPAGWSPDVQAFIPGDVIPEALIFRGSTVVTQTLQGDGPAARVPWVNDDTAQFVAEGEEIPEADDVLDEAVVRTGKISKLVRLSREQYTQQGTAALMSESVQRSVIAAANTAFLANPAPGGSDPFAPPAGLANVDGIIDGGSISGDLDALADVLGQVEANGGAPGLIAAHPLAWSALRRLKTGADSNAALLGAGTNDQEKRLFGVEVVTSPAVPAGALMVLDPTAIPSAVGSLEVAASEHELFSSDNILLRCTMRVGWNVMHENRLAIVSVEDPSGS